MSGARHYNNLGGRRPFGSNMERLDVYSAHMGKKQQWPKVYVEGIPTNVTLLGREGIPAIKVLIENILDWPLAEGTEFRLAEAVHIAAISKCLLGGRYEHDTTDSSTAGA